MIEPKRLQWVAFLALLFNSAAGGAENMNSLAEGYATYTVMHWVRTHPLGTFIAVVVVMIALAIAVLVVTRRVKREVQDYAISTRTRINHARDRLSHLGHRREGPSEVPRRGDGKPGERDIS